MYSTTQTSDLWPRGAKILKGVKKFVTFFSKVVLPISMKFGMMGALRGSRSYLIFVENIYKPLYWSRWSNWSCVCMCVCQGGLICCCVVRCNTPSYATNYFFNRPACRQIVLHSRYYGIFKISSIEY